MKNIFITALISLSILINIFSFNRVQDWGDDFAGYVIQAKTIHTGAYTKLEADIKRNDFILNYPWGFPLLISPVIKYFDSNIIIIKIYIYLFFLAGLILVFYLFRKDKEIALLTVLFISSSPYFWEFKNYILADFPNLFFVLLTLLVANRFLIKRKTIINEYVTSLVIGTLVFISYMIRNQSIVLLPAIIFVEAITFRRELFTLKRILLIFIPVLAFLFLKALPGISIPIKSVTYLNQYANLQLGKTVRENIIYYLNIWSELFATTNLINNITHIFTWFFLVFVFIGAIISARQNILFIVFCGATLLLVLISPFHQGVRYLVPLVPFFFYFFIIGFRYSVLHIHMRNRFRQVAYYSVTGLIVLLSIKTIFIKSYQSFKSKQELEGPYKKTSVEMFSYIRDSTNKNEIIGFLKPRAMLLYGGRNSVIPDTYEECIEKKIDYLVYYKNAGNTTEQLPLESLKSHGDNFHEVFTNEDFIIFKIQETDPPTTFRADQFTKSYFVLRSITCPAAVN